jgi:hypothetical protein
MSMQNVPSWNTISTEYQTKAKLAAATMSNKDYYQFTSKFAVYAVLLQRWDPNFTPNATISMMWKLLMEEEDRRKATPTATKTKRRKLPGTAVQCRAAYGGIGLVSFGVYLVAGPHPIPFWPSLVLVPIISFVLVKLSLDPLLDSRYDKEKASGL